MANHMASVLGLIIKTHNITTSIDHTENNVHIINNIIHIVIASQNIASIISIALIILQSIAAKTRKVIVQCCVQWRRRCQQWIAAVFAMGVTQDHDEPHFSNASPISSSKAPNTHKLHRS
jgi:hypothetical protein